MPQNAKQNTTLDSSQAGAVSLITVIILAIILSIITTGLLRLSIRDARQSLDDDLTNRAFFAAESGITDAVRFIERVQTDPSFSVADLNGDVCAPPTGAENRLGDLSSGDSALDVEYVCQLIDMTPEEIRTTLSEDDTVQIKLPRASSNLVIRWHKIGEDSTLAAMPSLGNFRGNTDKDLPTKTAWGNLPAMLRANLFSSAW